MAVLFTEMGEFPEMWGLRKRNKSSLLAKWNRMWGNRSNSVLNI